MSNLLEYFLKGKRNNCKITSWKIFILVYFVFNL